MEGETTMKNRLGIMIVATATALGIVAASADTSALFKRLYEQSVGNDSDHQSAPGNMGALLAGCNINTALQAIIKGDDKSFNNSIAAAEDSLRSSAKNLEPLSASKRFSKPVKLPPSLVPSINSSGSGAPTTAVPTGDQLLAEIARLATQSANALSEIRNGTGGQSQLELVIRNNGLIAQLIFAFYSSV
jgi:hypothetical protein